MSSTSATAAAISRSTRGASKQRRDQINIEIQRLRDMLPLAESVKDRLFQLQVMSLACIFIRKQRYLPHILGDNNSAHHCHPHHHHHHNRLLGKQFDSCKALRGFLMMITRQGKMLYISENASDYLGHSVEEIMSQGDSVYDLVDPRDHMAVQAELLSGPPSVSMNSAKFPDERVFICRMNLSRTAKRQLQYHKFVLIEGRYMHPAEYYQALLTLTNPAVFIHPVFAAYCQPLINPENAEVLSSGNTSMFRSLHFMDMQFVHLDDIGVFHLGYNSNDLEGDSWYRLVHPNDLPEVSFKHRLLCQEKEGSVICLIRLQTIAGHWLWLHTVLAVRGNFVHQPQEGRRVRHLIHATYQLLSDLEAATLQANSWIYSIRQNYSEFCSKNSGGSSGGTADDQDIDSMPPSQPPIIDRPLSTHIGVSQSPSPSPKYKSPPIKLEPIVPVAAAAPTTPTVTTCKHQICVEIPGGGKTSNLGEFGHMIASNMALNAILTPEHSSPESSISQVSSSNTAHSSKSSSGGPVGGADVILDPSASSVVIDFYRVAHNGNKQLPEIEPSALEDYLREMENGTIFDPSVTVINRPSSPPLPPPPTAPHNPNLVRVLQQRFGGANYYTELLMTTTTSKSIVDHNDDDDKSDLIELNGNGAHHHQQIQRHHSIQVTYPSDVTDDDVLPGGNGGIRGDPFFPHHHHPRMHKRLGSWAGV